MPKKIVTPYNYVKPDGQVFTEPTMTVPNQSMTVREIMLKHTMGETFEVSHNTPVYNGEKTLPDLSALSPVELMQYRESMQEEVIRLQSEYDEVNRKKMEADREELNRSMQQKDDEIIKRLSERIAAQP